MNSKKAEELLEKYWAGETSLQEEEALRGYFAAGLPAGKDAAYFCYLKHKSAENPLDASFDEAILEKLGQDAPTIRVRNTSFSYWLVAASLALILSIGVIFRNEIIQTEAPSPVVQADTFDDPEKAFEETKKALLFLSSKLNESSEYTSQLSKFDESQEIVKKN